MKQVMVTGANGFVGHHLIKELLAQGFSVIGTDRGEAFTESIRNPLMTYYGGVDLTQRQDVSKLPLHKVDAIINLAGLAKVGSSFDAEEEYHKINIAVHTTLADELLRRQLPEVRVVAISTGAVYDSHQKMPLRENGRLVTGGSPYALSKIGMEHAMRERRVVDGLDVVTVRPFNHIGPGQLPGFLIPDLVQQFRTGHKIVVGDISTERDYTDVRDVVKAYILLATTPSLSHAVYNVCSGTSVSGQDMLEKIAKAFGKTEVSIEVDAKLLRPNDPKKIFGSNKRLFEDTGWRPLIPLTQTINDIVSNPSSN